MVQASLAVLASKLGSRGGSRLRLLKSPVTLTEAATERIKQLLAKRHKVTSVPAADMLEGTQQDK